MCHALRNDPVSNVAFDSKVSSEPSLLKKGKLLRWNSKYFLHDLMFLAWQYLNATFYSKIERSVSKNFLINFEESADVNRTFWCKIGKFGSLDLF